MPSPVSIVYIHHEGAGAPTDTARGADGGYTYWIGTTKWQWLRDCWSSYATKSYNGVTVDVCLSGNRMDYNVSDGDLNLIEGALRDARNRGYVIASPEVRPHKQTRETACPGDKTMARWNDVAAAVLRGTGGSAPAPSPTPPPSGVPAYPGTPLRDYIEGHGTRTWQQQMANRGWSIGVDDKYGPQSANVCTQFQREKGLQVDGVVGPQTWNAAWTAPIT